MKKMRKNTSGVAKAVYGLLACLVVFFSGCGKKEGDVKVLKLAHALDTTHPVHKAIVFMADKVKEKSEFALSLGEVMTTPNVTSSTSAISSPRMTVEEPVGLLKFEKAFIEANIICNKSSVTIGEDFILEIQLANLGKGIAFLTRVDEIIPTEFEVAKRPEKCMVSNQSLTFSPRKLTPLETKEIKLTLKPKRKGEYLFAPRIQYLDETGGEKSCQLEQMTIQVKELGIRGWLRGPG